ncbi:MAG: peptidase M16, partial [Deltaproteobacteria bacterium]
MGESFPPRTRSDLRIEASLHTLRNGLRVVLSERHTTPTVAIAVYYDVGSRNEER